MTAPFSQRTTEFLWTPIRSATIWTDMDLDLWAARSSEAFIAPLWCMTHGRASRDRHAYLPIWPPLSEDMSSGPPVPFQRLA